MSHLILWAYLEKMRECIKTIFFTVVIDKFEFLLGYVSRLRYFCPVIQLFRKKSVLNCDIQYSFYFSLFLSKLGIEFVLSSVMMLIYCNLVKYPSWFVIERSKILFLTGPHVSYLESLCLILIRNMCVYVFHCYEWLQE